MKVGTKLAKHKYEKYGNISNAEMDLFLKRQLEVSKERAKNGPTYSDKRYRVKDTNEGMNFFDNGGRLSNEELDKKPYYFKIGYNIASRRDSAIKYEISNGEKFFYDGGNLDDLPDERKEALSPYFISGYENAKDETNIKTLNRKGK